MVNSSDIREHCEVVGSDGGHVGTVDHVEGTDRIKLTRRDPDAEGQHHFIPLSMVDSVDGDRVRLNVTADEAKNQWQADANQRSGSASM